MGKSVEMHHFVRLLMAVLAIAAAGISLWISVQKLTGEIDSLAGCGVGSGCANVLGSKWSVVFGVVPVSLLSLLLYLAVLVSLWLRGDRVRWFRVLAAWVFICAALWFTALQLWVLRAFCPYCMVGHGLGVAMGVLILSTDASWREAPRRLSGLLGVAIGLVSGFAVVQYYGPEVETHRVDDVVGGTGAGGIHADGEGRLVTFLQGGKSYRVAELPHLGGADAEHVIVKYFDYRCEACREVHNDLEGIMLAHPGKLAVLVLPVPLERACNPYLPLGLKDHQNSCELARLALRVWRADRARFAEFHAWLFDYHSQPVEVAEAMAYSLVGGEKMDAVEGKWIDEVLRQNVEDYRSFVKKTPVMPKMLLKGGMLIQGKAKDRATLEGLLDEHLGL